MKGNMFPTTICDKKCGGMRKDPLQGCFINKDAAHVGKLCRTLHRKLSPKEVEWSHANYEQVTVHVVLEQFLGSCWNLRQKLRAPWCYMDHVGPKYQFSSNSVYIQNLLHRNLATLDFYYWILDIIRIKWKLYFCQGERPYINAMHLVSLVNDIDYWRNLQVLRGLLGRGRRKLSKDSSSLSKCVTITEKFP